MILVDAFLIAALVAGAFGAPLIRFLRSLALRQHAYEDAPKTHQVKTGTPTMGGVLFLFGMLTALVLRPDPTTVALALLTAGCGIVGAIDDVSAIRRGRNRGLSARAKFIATAIAGAVFLAFVAQQHLVPIDRLFFPHVGISVAVWVALSLLVILATTHAVNLTDGLDGLAGGTVLPPIVLLGVFAFRWMQPSIGVFALAIAGAIAGFLWYNRYPARVFMGDTGALALGGALAGCAILTGTQLILPLLGGVFVAEALSVVLQVASFKSTGKRIFRMSPLHHHFELGGVSERNVVRSFWGASIALSAATAALLG